MLNSTKKATTTKATTSKKVPAKKATTSKKVPAKKVDVNLPTYSTIALEVINAIDEKHYPIKWRNLVKEMKGRQALHLHTLGVALEAYNLVMMKDGFVFNFDKLIEIGNITYHKEGYLNSTSWGSWGDEEIAGYDAILSGGKFGTKISKHIKSVITLMKENGYSFELNKVA